ncbi:MAG TPA: helix-hairpin-helix domain-containing protein [Chitinophagaceae bacterium]|nr:helix-hairpin-helix domain-containing protein [Chitinophagaceae bacterium]
MRKFINDYLSFTQKERVAVIALVALILIIYMLPRFVRADVEAPAESAVQAFRMLEQQLAQSTNGRDDDPGENDGQTMMHTAGSTYEDSRPARLFYFDPNTLDETGWQRLGLRSKTIGTIRKYVTKGGRFYKPSDLQKIYGLQPAEYERIAAYVRIENIGVKPAGNDRQFTVTRQREDAHAPGGDKPGKPAYKTSDEPGNGTHLRYAPKTIQLVDINSADTSEWVALPGIGSKLAARIVFFRERIGGFHEVEQLSEVYGLPDSTFQRIKPYLRMTHNTVRKLNINSGTLELLKQHPYIKWNIAKAIIAYRTQHGTFKSLEELQQIEAISPEAYRKMAPYLSIE